MKILTKGVALTIILAGLAACGGNASTSGSNAYGGVGLEVRKASLCAVSNGWTTFYQPC